MKHLRPQQMHEHETASVLTGDVQWLMRAAKINYKCATQKLIKSWSENVVFLCAWKDAEAPRSHFFAEGLAEAHVFRNSGHQQFLKPFRRSRSQNSAEDLRGNTRGRWKQKKLQALLAEGLRKGLAEGVVSVVKSYRNKTKLMRACITQFRAASESALNHSDQ